MYDTVRLKIIAHLRLLFLFVHELSAGVCTKPVTFRPKSWEVQKVRSQISQFGANFGLITARNGHNRHRHRLRLLEPVPDLLTWFFGLLDHFLQLQEAKETFEQSLWRLKVSICSSWSSVMRHTVDHVIHR
jgi:hypothetical protein